jgi:hypothetical protein
MTKTNQIKLTSQTAIFNITTLPILYLLELKKLEKGGTRNESSTFKDNSQTHLNT